MVEDHDDARDLIAGVLERAGGRVVARQRRAKASRARGANGRTCCWPISACPGKTGIVLLTRFRTIYPDVPAIALTAYARATDRDRVLAAGFAHHVIKPVDPNQLVDLIVKAIEP